MSYCTFICYVQCHTPYEETFLWVITTFEENDAGFRLVTDKKGEQDYRLFTQKMTSRVKEAKDQQEFISLVNEWLGYFRKAHHGFAAIRDQETTTKEKPQATSSPPKDTPDRRMPSLSRLSEHTLLLRIPSYHIRYKKYLDQLLKENDQLLRSTPNLMIDVRDNGGGATHSWSGLIPYFYTNPVRQMNMEIYCTEQNARGYEQEAEILFREGNKEPAQKRLAWAKKMREHTGEFIPADHRKVIVVDKFSPLPYPERVGILCNENCASATEQFLYIARQSTKVKIFGKPTFGALDVTNTTAVDSPDGKYRLVYCMARSLRAVEMSMDGTGIQPDYLLDSTIPEEQWTEYVQEILENR